MTARIERHRAPDTERYAFDFDLCHYLRGWAQFDTGQDAPYFGQWGNPSELRVVTFCEGDVTIENADSPEEFADTVRRHAEWNAENGFRFAIDGMCQPSIVEKFEGLGLGDLLH